MTIIQIDPIGTTSLACTTSTISDLVDDSDALSTTATGVATSITAAGGINTSHVHITAAERYVGSLSDSQLCEMIDQLNEFQKKYEANITIGKPKTQQLEPPKVYQKKIF